MKVIIIFGPPGAGKGTQANLICKKLNFIHFSTGEALRNEIAKKTKLGNQIADIISKGDLVTDELSTQITKNFIIANKNKDVLLDGFPRTLKQAENLLEIFKEFKINKCRNSALNKKIFLRLLLTRKIDIRRVINK